MCHVTAKKYEQDICCTRWWMIGATEQNSGSLRRIDRAQCGCDSSVFPFSPPPSPPAFSPLALSLSHIAFILGRVRAFVVFRRCCWRKVESTWGRVASMAPAANGRAALQTLISCRFRGPSRFYLSTSKSVSGPLLFSLRPFGSRRHSPCPFTSALTLRAICMELLLMKFVI